MDNQECYDAIHWIGQSYVHILCGRQSPEGENFCYLENGKEKRCYVHEAESRGCCRKIPQAMDWLIPRKSLIFLAHRGGHEEPTQGSIFGYFVLKRFEHIISEKVGDALFDDDKLPWVEETCQQIIGNVLETIEERKIQVIRGRDRNMLEELIYRQFEKHWLKGFKRQIERGFCVTPRAIPTLPPEWPSEQRPVRHLTDSLEGIIEEQIKEWTKSDETFTNIRERADENHAYIELPAALLEESRFCSKRLKVGATYMVDALTAEITDLFNRKLAKKSPESIAKGEKIFRETINEAREEHQPGTLSKIDPRLKSHATMRGELVLFDQPFPLFLRMPNAAFRGLLQVNGTKLIDEIKKYYTSKTHPKITYCWAASDVLYPRRFAQDHDLSITQANAIVQLYGKRIAKLKDGQSIDLPGVGKFLRIKGEIIFSPSEESGEVS